MSRQMSLNHLAFIGLAQVALTLLASSAYAAGPPAMPSVAAEHVRIVEYWTGERRANAIPRDLVLDSRGLAYLRMPNGFLQPYGHQIAAITSGDPRTMGKPVGGDTTPPSISGADPNGIAISDSHVFNATVIDSSGVKSVTFTIRSPSGTSQSFSASLGSNNVWAASLQGFTDGIWSWTITAKDNASRGGNMGTGGPYSFTVNTGGGGGGTGTVTNAQWTAEPIQTAAGRLYFEMPNNKQRTGPWTGYVCSGTVVNDGGTSARSIILTAAHCVYDDAHAAFARNVMFFPDQTGTTSTSGTDRNCSNDPIGCWTPSFGVVDADWTTRTFPNNEKWDYAFYVVGDSGHHTQGLTTTSTSILDTEAGSLPISFVAPQHDVAGSTDFSHAFGYSYSEDPKLMYCAEDMTTTGTVNWWLPSCGMTGGSSGGPWVQPLDSSSKSGPVISVNSWGYTNSPGMAGPKLSTGTSASCVFSEATTTPFTSVPVTDGNAGVASGCAY